MVLTSSLSSSSCTSFSSFDEVAVKACSTVKFLCSYGGRILPRYPDGKLRYVGGDTRVLSVDRSIPFSELQMKMGELCGWEAVNLRCQLPAEDLDALVSITSDEDLANIMEEYDLASRDRQCPLKIRAFVHTTPAKSPKSASPPATPFSLVVPRDKASFRHPAAVDRCVHHTATCLSTTATTGNNRSHQESGRRCFFWRLIIGGRRAIIAGVYLSSQKYKLSEILVLFTRGHRYQRTKN